jgi:Zn-dependent peptidase ImmA (M78 family)
MSRIVRQIKMPLTIRAFTLPDANGDFNIYINEALSDEAKRKSLAHEYLHIENNDFQKNEFARMIEEKR